MNRLFARAWPAVVVGFLLVGCATAKIDWASRVGNYNYDQSVLEFGPPDKSAKLSDGTLVAEWVTSRGHAGYYSPWYYDPYYPFGWYDTPTPDRALRLTFDPEGRLKAWQRVVRY